MSIPLSDIESHVTPVGLAPATRTRLLRTFRPRHNSPADMARRARAELVANVERAVVQGRAELECMEAWLARERAKGATRR